MSVAEQPVVFAVGNDQLLGILHLAAVPSARLGVVIVVGGPQYRIGSHRQFVLLARALAHAGFSTLRFDYRGMGDAEGAPRSFETIDDDIRAAIDTLCAQAGVEGVVLWGLCDAASAILMYCASDARVRAMVLVNPWVRTESGAAQTYLRHYYVQRFLSRAFWRSVWAGEYRLFASLRDFFSKLRVAHGRTETPPAHFIDRMRQGLTQFAGPTLLLMSERDLTAREFDELCMRDERWRALMSASRVHRVDLAAADHTFSTRTALEAAHRACLEWLRTIT